MLERKKDLIEYVENLQKNTHIECTKSIEKDSVKENNAFLLLLFKINELLNE
jgi:hypothetical protein